METVSYQRGNINITNTLLRIVKISKRFKHQISKLLEITKTQSQHATESHINVHASIVESSRCEDLKEIQSILQHLLFSILGSLANVQEAVKEDFQILWPSHCLRMKLDTEKWPTIVNHSFICVVIGIREQN